MNNKNKESFNNDVEINVSEENIILAPPTELFDEAKEIAQTTVGDEKFPFELQYDSNQKEFLLSMLEAVGAIIENDDDNGHILATMMNMTQLAFIKQLDCIERVKTDEGEVHNPFFIQEAQPAATTATVASAVSTEIGTVQIEQLETLAVNDGIAVASASAGASNSYGYSNNSTMDTAKVVSDESYTSGHICCPGNEQ